jgi:glycosyltransferase involved in cell wall biosynthesis
MSFKLGIGIVTYNRKDIVSETIDRVRAFTRTPDVALVVADDGSRDGTADMLRGKGLPVVTGVNMGNPWNKNRVLFLLSHVLHCDIVILLEDDTMPEKPGWETVWIDATRRWGHVNYAGDWISKHFQSGSGTAEDPVLSAVVTAQCSSFSADALTYGGYFDSRFRGYGHAHVEHSIRLIRLGFGGVNASADGMVPLRYFMVRSALSVVPSQSYFNQVQERRNLDVARQIMGDQTFRAPWRDNAELQQFRSEMDAAAGQGAEHFRMTPT